MRRGETSGAARSGEAILAERARPSVVFALVCLNAPALVAAIGPVAAVALISGEITIALSLAPSLAAAIAMTVYGRSREMSAARRGEALVSVAASFAVAVFFAAPGFVALGMTPVDALFEAASSVTTTGLSMAAATGEWPFVGHFMRAWLQWIGGFAFIAAALALVIGQGVVAKRLGAAGGVADDRAGSTRARARQLLAVYVGLTIAAVVFVAAVHPDAAKGGLIALSAISTGGFSPIPDSVAGAGLAAQVATALACLLGAISLGLWWLALREGPLAMTEDKELRLFCGVLVGGVAAVAAMEWSADGATVWEAAFTAISAQTTAGFSVGDVSSLQPASLLALIAIMIVGGCLGSTAGGVKAFRLGFVFAALRLMSLRARTPASAKTYLRVFGRRTEPEEGSDVMGLLALYGLATLALWFLLILTGAAPLPALFDTVSALSTVGLSIGAITPDLPDGVKLATTFAMLLGRLEFLALIVLLSPGTWTKR